MIWSSAESVTGETGAIFSIGHHDMILVDHDVPLSLYLCGCVCVVLPIA